MPVPSHVCTCVSLYVRMFVWAFKITPIFLVSPYWSVISSHNSVPSSKMFEVTSYAKSHMVTYTSPDITHLHFRNTPIFRLIILSIVTNTSLDHFYSFGDGVVHPWLSENDRANSFKTIETLANTRTREMPNLISCSFFVPSWKAKSAVVICSVVFHDEYK